MEIEILVNLVKQLTNLDIKNMVSVNGHELTDKEKTDLKKKLQECMEKDTELKEIMNGLKRGKEGINKTEKELAVNEDDTIFFNDPNKSKLIQAMETAKNKSITWAQLFGKLTNGLINTSNFEVVINTIGNTSKVSNPLAEFYKSVSEYTIKYLKNTSEISNIEYKSDKEKLKNIIIKITVEIENYYKNVCSKVQTYLKIKKNEIEKVTKPNTSGIVILPYEILKCYLCYVAVHTREKHIEKFKGTNFGGRVGHICYKLMNEIYNKKTDIEKIMEERISKQQKIIK